MTWWMSGSPTVRAMVGRAASTGGPAGNVDQDDAAVSPGRVRPRVPVTLSAGCGQPERRRSRMRHPSHLDVTRSAHAQLRRAGRSDDRAPNRRGTAAPGRRPTNERLSHSSPARPRHRGSGQSSGACESAPTLRRRSRISRRRAVPQIGSEKKWCRIPSQGLEHNGVSSTSSCRSASPLCSRQVRYTSPPAQPADLAMACTRRLSGCGSGHLC